MLYSRSQLIDQLVYQYEACEEKMLSDPDSSVEEQRFSGEERRGRNCNPVVIIAGMA